MEEENNFFYRFRTLKNIFEYKELENLEIYFASNEELNDPMEAYKTVIFQGDNIMWHNLFKHYIILLLRYILVYEIKGNMKNIVLDTSNILDPLTNEKYSNIYYELFTKIYKKFREYFTNDINNIFSKNIINAEELKIYLLIFNRIIIDLIGMFNYNFSTNKINKHIEQNKQQIITSVKENKNIFKQYGANEQYQSIISQTFKDIYPKNRVNNYNFKNKEIYKYENYIQFVNNYVNYLTNYVKYHMYIASFNTDYTNPVMWSHYTENHKGVCLIYKNINNKIELFKDETYTKTRPPKNITLELQKVDYKYKKYTINFFYSLLHTNGEIKEHWFQDFITKEKSDLYNNYINNEKYQQHLHDLLALSLYKTDHWCYEQEYRLILANGYKIEKEEKIYKYKFKYLDGIIFGIKTPLDAKLKIMKIVENLCNQNTTSIEKFNIYQAYYSENENLIRYYKVPFTEPNHE